MSFLNNLMGGGDERGQDYQDFVQRYAQGSPYDGFSDEEALQRHDEVAQNLSPEEYQQSAYEALEQMDPQERAQFGEQLREQGYQQGLDLPGLDRAGDGDPNLLSGLLGGMHAQNPSMLGQLMGGPMAGGLGGGGGGLGGLVSGALGGGNAMGGGGLGGMAGGLLGGGASKGVLGGIAAMAARRYLG